MRAWTRERLLWSACALAGLAALVLGFLPAFKIHLDASIGGGESQKTFDYDRTWSLAGYGTAWSIAALAGAAAVVAVALVALWRGQTRAALIAVAVLALAGSAFTTSAGWVEDGGGVESCESWSDCGGAFLNPGVQHLRRDAMRRPEAQRSEYELLPGYAARPLAAWNLLELLSLALLIVTGFLAFRLNPPLLRAGPIFPFIALGVLHWARSKVDCSSGMSSAEGALEGVSLYPLGLAALAGVAALKLGRRKLAWLTLVLAVLATPLLWIGLLGCGD